MRPQPVPVVVMGVGKVGRAVVSHIVDRRESHAERLALRLEIAAVADRSGILQPSAGGLSDAILRDLEAHKTGSASLAEWRSSSGELRVGRTLDAGAVEAIGPSPILVDTTAGTTTASLVDARGRGWRVVLANKLPLCGPLDAFHTITRGGHGARWETTVAAALPVVATLQTLLDRGDEIRWISGTLSGTLGHVCAALERGEPFSKAVRQAVDDGVAEPDPRADLAGVDAARKALILARMMGYEISYRQVEREDLLPDGWSRLERDEMMARLPELDSALARRASALADGRVRYLTTIGQGRVRCELVAIDARSPLTRGDALDSVAVFETASFHARPLVLSGRGGGPVATAVGVVGDIVSLAREAAGAAPP